MYFLKKLKEINKSSYKIMMLHSRDYKNLKNELYLTLYLHIYIMLTKYAEDIMLYDISNIIGCVCINLLNGCLFIFKLQNPTSQKRCYRNIIFITLHFNILEEMNICYTIFYSDLSATLIKPFLIIVWESFRFHSLACYRSRIYI